MRIDAGKCGAVRRGQNHFSSQVHSTGLYHLSAMEPPFFESDAGPGGLHPRSKAGGATAHCHGAVDQALFLKAEVTTAVGRDAFALP